MGKYTPGPPIDLDAEPVTVHGEKVDEQRAEQIAAETLAEARRRNLQPGGKSLSGGRKHSPVVQFRVPETTKQALDAQAEKLGVSPSKVGRLALEEYLQKHG